MREKGRKLLTGGILLVGFLCALTYLPHIAFAKQKITLKLANDKFQLIIEAKTLGDVLTELGLELPEDYLKANNLIPSAPPPEEISLPKLFVYRLSEEEQIPPSLKYRLFPTQAEPKIEVQDEGKAGVRRVNITVFALEGRIVGGRTSSQVIREPKPKVVAIYKPVESDLIPDYETILQMGRLASRELKPPLRAKKVLTMEATAYSPENANDSWGDPYSTAIGLRAGFGVVAVDPKVIPLKTRLYIEGYGYAIAGDVGGAIKGMRIDLGFDTEKEAIKFGRRKVKVWVLD